jgi:hypothetical protein
MLTPVALAHIIMGDGSVQRYGLIICTDCYSIEDTIRLINVLIIRYRLECTLRVHRTNQTSMPSLLNIVSPYMHPSMLYKLKSSRPGEGGPPRVHPRPAGDGDAF